MPLSPADEGARAAAVEFEDEEDEEWNRDVATVSDLPLELRDELEQLLRDMLPYGSILSQLDLDSALQHMLDALRPKLELARRFRLYAQAHVECPACRQLLIDGSQAITTNTLGTAVFSHSSTRTPQRIAHICAIVRAPIYIDRFSTTMHDLSLDVFHDGARADDVAGKHGRLRHSDGQVADCYACHHARCAWQVCECALCILYRDALVEARAQVIGEQEEYSLFPSDHDGLTRTS